MTDDSLLTPQILLNVPRNADLDEIEAAFAARYKAARRFDDADERRQALNQALETLRDPDRRATAEVRGYHLPLDPTARLPELAEAVVALWPPEPLPDPLLALPPVTPTEELAARLAAQPAPDWPAPAELLRRLAARLALERLDPWEEPS